MHRLNRLIASIATATTLGVSGADAQTLSTFGTPGLVDMPTAEVLPDGHVGLTTSGFDNTWRNTFMFQMLPRVYGTFRYSILRDFSGPGRDLFDRSFDVHFQALTERRNGLGLAIGLRDFGGTGVYQGEYVVATKTVNPRLKFTTGIGWGRLAQRGSFRNPLGIIDKRFETRPGGFTGPGGQFEANSWFRGPAAIFGGAEFALNDRLSFQLEYSSDAYEREAASGSIDIKTPINVGVSYKFDNGARLRSYVIGGSEIGLQFSYVFNPAERVYPGGVESAPLPIPPRNEALLASADLDDPEARRGAELLLERLMAEEGLTLTALSIDGARATVQVQNLRWYAEAQAVGRASRAMANTLPATIDVFTIILQQNGMPITSVTLRRSDLEELQTDFDGAWRSYARARIEDAPQTTREGELPEAFPEFQFGLGYYTAFSFFDPDRPLRFETGPLLSLAYRTVPGLSFNGTLRYPFYSNLDGARGSNSVLPRVRTDAARYAQESEIEVAELTTEYLFKPGEDLFGRVTVGYLERMFGGISAEVLWYPIDNNLALGAEINYVQQRDFDGLLGFQDYSVITGHASAYYDLRNGFRAQVDAGRYLAGDWGATFTLDREFNNGFRIGGFFTLTNVSAAEFGEGSFDKGIRVDIPVAWLVGQPSRRNIRQVIRPTTRDGGARLNVRNRLYEVTRDYRGQELSDSWGRIFR